MELSRVIQPKYKKLPRYPAGRYLVNIGSKVLEIIPSFAKEVFS